LCAFFGENLWVNYNFREYMNENNNDDVQGKIHFDLIVTLKMSEHHCINVRFKK